MSLVHDRRYLWRTYNLADDLPVNSATRLGTARDKREFDLPDWERALDHNGPLPGAVHARTRDFSTIDQNRDELIR